MSLLLPANNLGTGTHSEAKISGRVSFIYFVPDVCVNDGDQIFKNKGNKIIDDTTNEIIPPSDRY